MNILRSRNIYFLLIVHWHCQYTSALRKSINLEVSNALEDGGSIRVRRDISGSADTSPGETGSDPAIISSSQSESPSRKAHPQRAHAPRALGENAIGDSHSNSESPDSGTSPGETGTDPAIISSSEGQSPSRKAHPQRAHAPKALGENASQSNSESADKINENAKSQYTADSEGEASSTGNVPSNAQGTVPGRRKHPRPVAKSVSDSGGNVGNGLGGQDQNNDPVGKPPLFVGIPAVNSRPLGDDSVDGTGSGQDGSTGQMNRLPLRIGTVVNKPFAAIGGSDSNASGTGSGLGGQGQPNENPVGKPSLFAGFPAVNSRQQGEGSGEGTGNGQEGLTGQTNHLPLRIGTVVNQPFAANVGKDSDASGTKKGDTNSPGTNSTGAEGFSRLKLFNEFNANPPILPFLSKSEEGEGVSKLFVDDLSKLPALIKSEDGEGMGKLFEEFANKVSGNTGDSGKSPGEGISKLFSELSDQNKALGQSLTGEGLSKFTETMKGNADIGGMISNTFKLDGFQSFDKSGLGQITDFGNKLKEAQNSVASGFNDIFSSAGGTMMKINGGPLLNGKFKGNWPMQSITSTGKGASDGMSPMANKVAQIAGQQLIKLLIREAIKRSPVGALTSRFADVFHVDGSKILNRISTFAAEVIFDLAKDALKNSTDCDKPKGSVKTSHLLNGGGGFGGLTNLGKGSMSGQVKLFLLLGRIVQTLNGRTTSPFGKMQLGKMSTFPLTNKPDWQLGKISTLPLTTKPELHLGKMSALPLLSTAAD